MYMFLLLMFLRFVSYCRDRWQFIFKLCMKQVCICKYCIDMRQISEIKFLAI